VLCSDLICRVECLFLQMDRTSILGDTIDYMKELLEKINNLQQVEVDSSMAGIFKDVKPNEIIVRNSPKVWIFPVTYQEEITT